MPQINHHEYAPIVTVDSPQPGRLRRFLRALGPAGPMALLATLMPAIGALVLAGFVHELAPWLKSHGLLALALFIPAFAILGGFALVPTYANSMLAGWTFGFPVGFPAVLLGLLGAGAISFLVARRISGHRVEDLIHQ